MKNLLKSIAVTALALLLAFSQPVDAKRLAAITITGPVTAQISLPIQTMRLIPPGLSIQARLAYGSGGTTITAWVQTSLDGGVTWNDVAAFGFTTASSTKVMNVNSQTPALTPITITDGTLANDTAKDGMVGPQWRVKYTTTGTYAGNTQLFIDVNGTQFTTSP